MAQLKLSLTVVSRVSRGFAFYRFIRAKNASRKT